MIVQGYDYSEFLPGQARIITGEQGNTQTVLTMSGHLQQWSVEEGPTNSPRRLRGVYISVEYSDDAPCPPCLYDRLEALYTTQTPFSIELPYAHDAGYEVMAEVAPGQYITQLAPISKRPDENYQVYVGGLAYGGSLQVDERTGTLNLQSFYPSGVTVAIETYTWKPTCVVQDMSLTPGSGILGNRHTYSGSVTFLVIHDVFVDDPFMGIDRCGEILLADNATTLDQNPALPPSTTIFPTPPTGSYTDYPLFDLGTGYTTQTSPFVFSTASYPRGHILTGYKLSKAEVFAWPSVYLASPSGYSLLAYLDLTFPAVTHPHTFAAEKTIALGGYDLATQFLTPTGSTAFGEIYLQDIPLVSAQFDPDEIRDTGSIVLRIVDPRTPTTPQPGPTPFGLQVAGQALSKPLAGDHQTLYTNYVVEPLTAFPNVDRIKWEGSLGAEASQGPAVAGEQAALSSYINASLGVYYSGLGSPPKSFILKSGKIRSRVSQLNPSDATNFITNVSASTNLATTPLVDTALEKHLVIDETSYVLTNGSASINLQALATARHTRIGAGVTTVDTNIDIDLELVAPSGWNSATLRLYHAVPAPTNPFQATNILKEGPAGFTEAFTPAQGSEWVQDTYETLSTQRIVAGPTAGTLALLYDEYAPLAAAETWYVVGVRVVFQARAINRTTLNGRVEIFPAGTPDTPHNTSGIVVTLSDVWQTFTVGDAYTPLQRVPLSASEWELKNLRDAAIRVSTASCSTGQGFEVRGLRVQFYAVPPTND